MSDTSDSTKSRDHYRTELNNFLQVNGGVGRLDWQTAHQGPQHDLIWTASCYIDGVEHGSASSNSLGDAKEKAAHITHRALMFQAVRQRMGMVA